MDDFKAQQFAMDSDGTICMVDGPKPLTESPLGKAALRRWPLKGRRSVPRVLNNTARACRKDTDCPAFKENLSCRGEPGIHTPCETGAVGASVGAAPAQAARSFESMYAPKSSSATAPGSSSSCDRWPRPYHCMTNRAG